MKGSIVSEILDAKEEMDDVLSQEFPYQCLVNFYIKTGIRIEDVKVEWIDMSTIGDRGPVYKIASAKTDTLHLTVR